MAAPTREAALSEAVDIRLHRSESWLRKARKAGDLDSQFIFLWIAINALYGRPRYRRPEIPGDEPRDLGTFIGKVEEASRAQLATVLGAQTSKDTSR